ncbi:MAG: hypothetical protein JWN56_977 [Sphingobacteriales bacterium]|nr:hypothetical protein [Sphingobacteriales bacterium]
MFTSISWQQYLVAVTSLAAVYYAVVLAFYYRDILKAALGRKSKSAIDPSSENQAIIGEIKPNNRETLLPSEELQFSSEN